MRRLTIVIPVLNEATIIAGALQALAPLRARGAEVIVADGGSRDGTAQLAQPLADRVITAPQGRGAPMNAGAALGNGDALLFLHADTTLPENADRLIAAHSPNALGPLRYPHCRTASAACGRSPE
jgi:glycosyltransferase involved in cell wall biosynthesis